MSNSLITFIEQNNTFIVCPSSDASYDSFPAALSICLLIQSQNKDATIFSTISTPHRLKFLPFTEINSNKVQYFQKTSFVIESDQDVTDMSYVKQGDVFYIIVKKGKNIIPYKNLRVQPPKESDQRAITIGCSAKELEILSEKYSVDPENILTLKEKDLKENNSDSYCELITKIFKMNSQATITKEIATTLLAGIITTTNNFQNENVKPQSLFTAAYLISKNANKESIIYNLYNKRTLAFMRLWGEILKRFSNNPTISTGWSYIYQQEIEKQNISKDEIILLLEELRSITLSYSTIILGIQNNNTLICICSVKDEMAQSIASSFNTKSKKGIVSIPIRLRGDINQEIKLLAQKIHSL